MAEGHGDAKGATAHTEAEGGHKVAFPPFQKDTFASQLVSLVIAFVALYLIVSRIALPRVGGVLDARQNAIDNDLAEAQELKDASDTALKAYESELAAARSRAQAIGNETREKLNAASEAERKTLDGQLSERLAEAEKTIASTREAAMDEPAANNQPLTRPGISSGSVMVSSTRNGDAPRLAAARS